MVKIVLLDLKLLYFKNFINNFCHVLNKLFGFLFLFLQIMTVEVSVVVIGLLLTHQVAGQTRELLPNYIGEENQPALPPSTM